MATVLAFHAHPDDEVLLTGGTLAGLAADGHRVIIVVACDGVTDPPDRIRFVRADLDEAAARLADLIRSERVDVLLSYDQRGGYGHRDHVKVHQVGARAAEMTGTRILEATLPRELVAWACYPLRLARLVVRYDPQVIRSSFTPRKAITHRIDVRRFAGRKQTAMAAHHHEWQGTGRAGRLARVMLALPVPLFRLFFGREWFIDPAATRSVTKHDILERA